MLSRMNLVYDYCWFNRDQLSTEEGNALSGARDFLNDYYADNDGADIVKHPSSVELTFAVLLTMALKLTLLLDDDETLAELLILREETGCSLLQ
jgi:hypothetical protein